MGNALSAIVASLNFFPGLKTKIAAVAALALAVVQAWNAAAVPLELVDYTINVPDLLNAAVLALLGAGAANQPANAK